MLRDDVRCSMPPAPLRIPDGAVAEIVTFHDDQFPRFGLPQRLAEEP